jgi:hypothetical protein
MDTKKKRRNLIIGFTAFGVLFLLLSFMSKNIFTPLVVFFAIVPLSYFHFFSGILEWNEILSMIIAISGQLAVYFILGWIVAGLLYPDKKSLAETNQNTTQDENKA